MYDAKTAALMAAFIILELWGWDIGAELPVLDEERTQ